MEAKAYPNVKQSWIRHWLHLCRPLLWWLVFVVFLFIIRTHERLSERTRIYFAVALDGQNLPFMQGASSTFDKKPIGSGQIIPIGWHTFTITHPKAEPFTTNVFVWYGEHDFERINLKRAKGTLEIHVDPRSASIILRGPDYSATLTNCSSETLTLPTDDYLVEATFAHWHQHENVIISDRKTNSLSIAPSLGALSLTCNREQASFELVASQNQLIEVGGFPNTILEVPEGTYTLRTEHHRNRFEQSVTVKAGTTSSAEVELAYGGINLTTEPSGATVLTDNGHEWGTTPLSISELPVGTWHFKLNRNGYERASVSLQVTSGTVANFVTNLVSLNYTAAITAAEHYFAIKDYVGAFRASQEALLAKPDDPGALKIKQESAAYQSLWRAEDLGKKGDYIAGIAEMEKALSALTNNTEAIQLYSDFKEREPAQREELRLARLHQGENGFKVVLGRHSAEEFFERHEVITPKPVKEIGDAIAKALTTKPEFQTIHYKWIAPEIFEIEGTQEFSTYLATSAGKRVCVIVGARTTDEDTQVLFKVLEYKTEAVYKFSVGNLIGAPNTVNYVPIRVPADGKLPDKLKAQLNEGISNLTARIQTVTGSPEK